MRLGTVSGWRYGPTSSSGHIRTESTHWSCSKEGGGVILGLSALKALADWFQLAARSQGRNRCLESSQLLPPAQRESESEVSGAEARRALEPSAGGGSAGRAAGPDAGDRPCGSRRKRGDQ